MWKATGIYICTPCPPPRVPTHSVRVPQLADLATTMAGCMVVYGAPHAARMQEACACALRRCQAALELQTPGWAVGPSAPPACMHACRGACHMCHARGACHCAPLRCAALRWPHTLHTANLHPGCAHACKHTRCGKYAHLHWACEEVSKVARSISSSILAAMLAARGLAHAGAGG